MLKESQPKGVVEFGLGVECAAFGQQRELPSRRLQGPAVVLPILATDAPGRAGDQSLLCPPFPNCTHPALGPQV